MEEFHHLPLADEYSNDSTLRLQVLVGLDYYWSFIDNTQSHRVGNVVGQLSKFGYLLSGRIENSTGKATHNQMLCIKETNGIKTNESSKHLLEHLHDLHKKKNKKSNSSDISLHFNSHRNGWGVC